MVILGTIQNLKRSNSIFKKNLSVLDSFGFKEDIVGQVR